MAAATKLPEAVAVMLHALPLRVGEVDSADVLRAQDEPDLEVAVDVRHVDGHARYRRIEGRVGGLVLDLDDGEGLRWLAGALSLFAGCASAAVLGASAPLNTASGGHTGFTLGALRVALTVGRTEPSSAVLTVRAVAVVATRVGAVAVGTDADADAEGVVALNLALLRVLAVPVMPAPVEALPALTDASACRRSSLLHRQRRPSSARLKPSSGHGSCRACCGR